MTDQYFLFDYVLPKYDLPETRTNVFRTISGEEVTLERSNVRCDDKPPTTTLRPIKVNIKSRQRAKYYRDDRVNRRMYVYHKDVPQLEIPFYEFKRVSRHDLDILVDAGWPAFMRDEQGDILSVYVSNANKDDAIEWCQTNFVHRFAYYKGRIVVQDINDYVAIKMLYR